MYIIAHTTGMSHLKILKFIAQKEDVTCGLEFRDSNRDQWWAVVTTITDLRVCEMR
jgi:hypothetical protein